MNVETVDHVALVFVALKWAAYILGTYILILLVVRFSGFFTLTVCPSCGHHLKRSKRKHVDKTIGKISLGILPVKRYRCSACYWSGPGLDLKPPVDATFEQKPA